MESGFTFFIDSQACRDLGYPSFLSVNMDFFAELKEYFLPTDKAPKQSADTPLLRSEIKGRINKIYNFISPGAQSCDCAANTTDIAGFLKMNGDTNSKYILETQ